MHCLKTATLQMTCNCWAYADPEMSAASHNRAFHYSCVLGGCFSLIVQLERNAGQ